MQIDYNLVVAGLLNAGVKIFNVGYKFGSETKIYFSCYIPFEIIFLAGRTFVLPIFFVQKVHLMCLFVSFIVYLEFYMYFLIKCDKIGVEIRKVEEKK